MKEKLFQIFFCLYLFWNVILCGYLSFIGGEMDGILMRVTLIGIAVISWIFYFIFPNQNPKESRLLIMLAIFGGLYYFTQYLYPYGIGNIVGYYGQFLRWGADCVSACLVGMTLTKLKSFDLIHIVLPWVCLFITPFMAIASISMGSDMGQYHMDSGMNYQTIAYAMAVLFCFSLFYSFIYDNGNKGFFIFKVVMMCVMIIQALCCAMSGGRGGLVLLIVYIVYMTSLMLRNKIISKSKFIILSIISLFGFLSLASYFGLWDSAGFARSGNSLNNDDRFLFWSQYLPYINNNLLFGNGLGGDYFTVGFYSHNMVVSWLNETGIFGLCVCFYVFCKSYKQLFKLAKYDSVFIVVMIMFVYGLVANMFSGYWISTNVHWLVFGVVTSRKNFYSQYC